jgi:dihydrodipicolinate synthase/N-acetylneuraminate lyase
MSGETSVAAARARLLTQVLPNGVPALWCPPLTHYDRDGGIDGARIEAHLRFLAPHVNGFLIPGTTGDGWELSEAEIRRLLEIVLDLAPRLDLRVLIGVLKSDAGAALETMKATARWIGSRTNADGMLSSLTKARVCGFAVCAPRGRDVSQADIGQSLASILEAGFPTALYQLPQMTLNEFSPEVASELARRFPNFILLKDSSGADRVVLSGKSLGGVFTMRGGESDYARWLKAAGGPYDGFLLGSANSFAREYSQLIGDVSGGRMDTARQLSQRLAATVSEVSGLVGGLPEGHAFVNANKALDHFFAHGPKAAKAPPPRLLSGSHLPVEVLRKTEQLLSRNDLLPVKGYL